MFFFSGQKRENWNIQCLFCRNEELLFIINDIERGKRILWGRKYHLSFLILFNLIFTLPSWHLWLRQEQVFRQISTSISNIADMRNINRKIDNRRYNFPLLSWTNQSLLLKLKKTLYILSRSSWYSNIQMNSNTITFSLFYHRNYDSYLDKDSLHVDRNLFRISPSWNWIWFWSFDQSWNVYFKYPLVILTRSLLRTHDHVF